MILSTLGGIVVGVGAVGIVVFVLSGWGTAAWITPVVLVVAGAAVGVPTEILRRRAKPNPVLPGEIQS